MPVTVVAVEYDVTGVEMQGDRICELALEKRGWSFLELFCLSSNKGECVAVSVDKLRYAFHGRLVYIDSVSLMLHLF